ncbi:MAG: nuclear transport factor 2 family protein [Gammaproteobacteria bacterium]|nr:nuclear transport factor 2 family protein [Gammaproteobacteria bacterium]NNF60325.1 nuclear transport factor 2 family protein [Gammaproteobacteria bacterium]NNM20631.1 nuclear transport factor 2 family protein [Gammaproteobacteria bacterium]
MRLYLLLLLLACANANASDEDAIALTAFDYMQGWYTGNAAQMERSLHPDLAKRHISTDEHGRARVRHMGAMRLVQLTRSGVGTRTPKEKQAKEIIILDVHGDTASVKAIMHGWIDYLHMVRIDGRWLIVNVLWDLKDGSSL